MNPKRGLKVGGNVRRNDNASELQDIPRCPGRELLQRNASEMPLMTQEERPDRGSYFFYYLDLI